MWLAAFYVDVFPTTNADYARFVASAGHTHPQHWRHAAQPPDGSFDHPVVFVTWHDAAAYASWSAKALPTAQHLVDAVKATIAVSGGARRNGGLVLPGTASLGGVARG